MAGREVNSGDVSWQSQSASLKMAVQEELWLGYPPLDPVTLLQRLARSINKILSVSVAKPSASTGSSEIIFKSDFHNPQGKIESRLGRH